MPGPEDISFDAASAIEETGDDDLFGATVHPLWSVGDKPNGGYLLALLGRAARLAASSACPEPRSASSICVASAWSYWAAGIPRWTATARRSARARSP